MIKFLTKYCTDNGTPKTIRTDNSSCFKSQEFKNSCKGENIKRIRSTPNLHTGTGLVERTIRTIKSLTRANLEDGLTFEESVTRAIKTIRQTMHNTLKMTPFQLHYGRKPRSPIKNLIGQPACLLTDWKKSNQLRFSSTCRITSLHHTRLRRGIGRLPGFKRVEEEG